MNAGRTLAIVIRAALEERTEVLTRAPNTDEVKTGRTTEGRTATAEEMKAIVLEEATASLIGVNKIGGGDGSGGDLVKELNVGLTVIYEAGG